MRALGKRVRAKVILNQLNPSGVKYVPFGVSPASDSHTSVQNRR